MISWGNITISHNTTGPLTLRIALDILRKNMKNL
nr:MAG TPA: hypothetical protein [Bacteriophage sp.]